MITWSERALSIYFEVKKWLDKEDYEKLLTIADYLGRTNRVAKFVINFNKIHKSNLEYEDVISILEDIGIALNEKILEKIKERILEKRTVRLIWDQNRVLLQTHIYLGEKFNKIRDFVTYDRRLRKIYVKPIYFFELKKKLNELGLRVIDETGLSDSLKLPFNIKLNVTLRDYQKEALNTWLNKGAKGVIALPTGAGKTIIAIAAMAKLSERTLIVSYTKEQMFQWQDMIVKFTDVKKEYIGLYYGEKKRLSPITISTYQTAYRHIDVLTKYFSFLIID
ncbi:MAG: ATP-dependent helicase, partial [Thermoprotei archaeon]